MPGADDFFAELRKIPPVTRIIVASTLVVTLGEIMSLVSIYSLTFNLKYLQHWQVSLCAMIRSDYAGLNSILDMETVYNVLLWRCVL